MDNQIDLQELLPKVITIGQEAADFIKSHFEQVSIDQIEAKKLNSLVSFVDKNAEKIIVASLRKLLPDAGFITEEDTPDDDHKEYVWVIDPLDGTTNFLQGLPHFSVSMALERNAEIILGVVIDIMQNDTYSAIKGSGAYRNGVKISVSQKKKLSEAVISTGFPYSHADRDLALKNTLSLFLDKVRGIRRFGSAALDLSYVACGRLDAYYETTLNKWDIAAGVLLVREAGGMVSNYKGEKDKLGGGDVMASNPHLAEEILKTLQIEYN